jgi:hypothetical protein
VTGGGDNSATGTNEMEPNNVCLELMKPTPTYHRVASFRFNFVAYVMVEGGVCAVRKLGDNEVFVTECGKLRQHHANFSFNVMFYASNGASNGASGAP